MDIDGYAFCAGLEALKLSLKDLETQNRLRSVAYLIRRAGLRPKHVTSHSNKFTLNIRPLGELMDMYHNRNATDWRDKIYALLGMSSDIPAGLSPNYSIAWRDLFRQLVHSIIGKQASIETWDKRQITVIKSMGCVLGIISSVSSAEAWDDKQTADVKIFIKKGSQTVWTFNDSWTLQASAKPIKQGDVVCLLQGASHPTIVRLYEDYCAIVAIAATPTESAQLKEIPPSWQDDLSHTETSNRETRRNDQLEVLPFRWQDYIRQKQTFPRELLLIWDWETDEGLNGANYERVLKSRVPEYSEAKIEDQRSKAIRLYNLGLLSEDSEKYEEAIGKHKKAMDIDGTIYKPIPSQLLELHNETRDLKNDPEGKTEWLRTMAHALGQKGDYTKVLEHAAVRIARSRSTFRMRQFLRSHRNQFPITAKVVKGAGENLAYGKEIMQLLFDPRGDQVPITEEVLKEIVGDQNWSMDIIELILGPHNEHVPITEEVMKTAAGNWSYGESIIELIIDRSKDQALITEEVMKAAAASGGKGIIELILDRYKDQAPITEEVMKTAVANQFHGKEIVKLILNRRKDQAPVTEEVMKEVVRNSFCGETIIDLILDQYKNQAPITEEVMKIAARDWNYGKGMIKIILDRLKDQTPITEEVIEQATQTWIGGHELIQRLRRQMIETKSQRPSVS
jgi:hypothetical protein